MSKRVVECNECGETLSAATDEELIRRVQAHADAEHGETEMDEQDARELVEEEAYDASDS